MNLTPPIRWPRARCGCGGIWTGVMAADCDILDLRA
jgi:hypothetical protein